MRASKEEVAKRKRERRVKASKERIHVQPDQLQIGVNCCNLVDKIGMASPSLVLSFYLVFFFKDNKLGMFKSMNIVSYRTCNMKGSLASRDATWSLGFVR